MDGQVFGTPSYMSPEQVVGRDIDARSDLFSVGVLLYEMMSGQKPFQGDSVVSITYAIMNKEPDPPAQINHSLWQVISRALDKSPALRYASAKEMIAALDQAQCHNGMVLDPVTPTIMGNPYAAPTGNPYMTPAPPQPPINYPFNPYQNPPQQPLPPQTGMPQPPFQIQNLPTHVYYPPPPRQPLLKPEQKAFLSRLFLTFVILGTFFLLFVVALLYYSGRLAVRERISTPPAVERIVSRQSQVGGVPTLPEDRVADQEMSRTADALVESGMQSLNAAQNSHYASDAVENFLRAAEDFEWAAKLSDGSRRQNFQSLAARSYLNAAQLLRELQRFADARECIYAARRCAPEDSDEAAVAQSLIEQFG
ncbi:MAG TPA: protein kinase [Fimbriimonadaceae bacterium]|nr:protein kinase [Fimbriimonadaceae bacterium]